MPKQAAWIAVALIGAGICAAAWIESGAAQAPSGPLKLNAGPAYTGKDGKDGPQFPRIDLLVRLSGGNGAQPVFKPGDLKVFFGGSEVSTGDSIRTFGDAGYGVKSILALDLSGSMSGAPLAAVRSTIARFVNQAGDQDRVEVLTIADDTRIDVPFGADKSVLAERLRQVTSRGTQTHLYDGLLDALAELSGTPPVCRQLTVISDGHDEGSRHTIDEVIQKAVEEKVSIDSIGITRSHPEFLQSLVRISQATGGNYARASGPEQLDALIDHGIQAMRAAPVVAFKLSRVPGDGKTHNLELRWQPEHLTATVDVQTPLIANSWTVWVWVLIACFLTGVVLLAVSRHQARRRQFVAAQPAALDHAQQRTPAPSAVRHSGETVVEADKAAAPAPPARAYAPTVVEGDSPAQPPMRAKTRVAAFFNAVDGGPMLEATAGPVTGKSYPVGGELLIGALDGNDLAIPDDPTLSGFHARVRLADSVLTIEDSRSTNGTFVNGVRLGTDRKLLKPGDEIRVGRSVFRVRGG